MDRAFQSGKSETKSEELESPGLKEEIAEELFEIFSKPMARDELGEGDGGQTWNDWTLLCKHAGAIKGLRVGQCR